MTRVEQYLESAFARAAPDHFAWQTRAAYVSERERALVRSAFLPLGRRVLDVGCAEGATLFHLGDPEGAVGVDLFEDKLAFGRTQLANCRLVEASVYELPFPDAAFDHVLLRDVIHHLDDPPRALSEIRRVLEPGGRLDILEPSRYCPLILAHALAKHEERGELRSTMRFIKNRVRAAGFEVTRTARHQALPVHRLLFHPELGRPSLGRSIAARTAVDSVERVAALLIPRVLWAYLQVRAVRPR